MADRVLILNADGYPLSLIPLSTVNWQLAVKLFFQDKSRILHSYENDILHSAKFSMPKPSVMILSKYHKLPSGVKFSRRNVFIRDGLICQYCNTRFKFEDLTIDHVIPRVMGGGTTWENCVASCKSCNSYKGKKLIKPINKPVEPKYHDINCQAKTFDLYIPDENWQLYLKWPEERLVITPN
jgi:5-methylcytosine-specific restriction endonuclease McrA